MASAIATVAAAACVLVYCVAAVRVATAPGSVSNGEFDRSAWQVLDRVDLAASRLTSGEGIWNAFRLSAELRAQHTLWSEFESVSLLHAAVRAGDAVLSPPEQNSLLDSLRVLAGRETLEAREVLIYRQASEFSERVFNHTGRVDGNGLRLLQRAKGATDLTFSARLLEPFFFARALSRREVRRMVTHMIGVRVRQSAVLTRQLQSRIRGYTPGSIASVNQG